MPFCLTPNSNSVTITHTHTHTYTVQPHAYHLLHQDNAIVKHMPLHSNFNRVSLTIHTPHGGHLPCQLHTPLCTNTLSPPSATSQLAPDTPLTYAQTRPLTCSCLMLSRPRSMPGLERRISARSSPAKMPTGVAAALDGDLLRGVMDPGMAKKIVN